MQNISFTDNPSPAENSFYWIIKIKKFYQTFYDVSICLSNSIMLQQKNRASYVIQNDIILISYDIWGYLEWVIKICFTV